MENKKVMIAMSGGVDSSVAAALLCEEGYECMGATMRLFCGSADDLEDAKKVASHLGMPFEAFSCENEFEENVIQRFISSYERGDTPNPCIDCNRYMKFGNLHKKAEECGFDYVATGHYAQIEYDSARSRYLLKKGMDRTKDQSYVLFSLTQEQLSRTIFPLGKYTKEQIRDMAQKYGFVNAEKKDSQDICFVPDGDYAEFIKEYTGKEYPPGDFVDKEGTVLGQHKGIIGYTIGQRRGLGLSLKESMYVVEKDMGKNEVILGFNDDLFGDRLAARDFNWIACEDPKPGEQVKCTAKTRYSQKEQPATARVTEDGCVEVVFNEPVRAITSGQSVVLYDGDIVIGGGTII